jgi:hypothetical protein
MKARLLILFIISPLFIFSQIKITGKVLDKETQEPVPNVIIHTVGGISVTDDAGKYVFEINQSTPVYFRHLAYDLVTIQSDSLPNNSTIYLIPSVIELSEVVISPNYIEDLLNKAMQNLLANFQKDAKNKTYYLSHTEGNTTTDGERETYALIEATISKINVEKYLCNWDLNLVYLDRISNLKANDFSIKGSFFSIAFFPGNIKSKISKNDSKCEVYEDNNDELKIKFSPQYPDKKHYKYFLFTINKQDTVITEIIVQSYSNSDELTVRKTKGVGHYISNQFYKTEYVKDVSGLYHLDKFQHLMVEKILSDTPYDMTFRVSTHAVKNISANGVKKKKIKPYDDILFKSNFPDSPGFWKQYLNP